MKEKFIGIDLGKDSASVCFLDSKGAVSRRATFPVNREGVLQFSRSLSKDSKIALEVSGNAYAVTQLLLQTGHHVTVSNPLLTKAIASSKIKTDKVDAKILAELLRCDYLPAVWVPDESTNELRLLASHRGLLSKMRTLLKNKIRSVLARNLIHYPFSVMDGVKGRQWLKNLDLPLYEKIQISTTLSILEAVEKEEKTFEGELAKRAHENPAAKLLMTIPGVNFTSALTILSAIGEPSRFKNPKKLSNYFGLVPSLYESGQTSRLGSITKQGSRLARWTLIQCANAAVRIDRPLGVFYNRIKKKKGHNVAVTAVADRHYLAYAY